jgi:hypothetical protein
MPKKGLLLYSYFIIFIAGFISFIIYFKNNNNCYLKEAAIICSFYGIALMQLYNYPRYEYFSSGVAMQGRYLFPVIVPFYAIMSYYLTDNFRNRLAIPILMCISVIFIYGDFPFFIENISIFDAIPPR